MAKKAGKAEKIKEEILRYIKMCRDADGAPQFASLKKLFFELFQADVTEAKKDWFAVYRNSEYVGEVLAKDKGSALAEYCIRINPNAADEMYGGRAKYSVKKSREEAGLKKRLGRHKAP